ncbi:hypothetical protein [Gordonia malaquae]|uniref:hypothetical protein n=1 Tax=Gordonia malaquae TaxID=410332 RepID=UPI003018A6C2
MMLFDFTVGTSDIRKALTAVAAHAASRPENARWWRVRIHLDNDGILIAASDMFSAGMAAVPVWATGDTVIDEGSFDIAPLDVQKILAVFKVGKEKPQEGGSPQFLLRVQVHDEQFPAESKDDPDVTVPMITLTDVSGLIPGETLEVTLLPPDDTYPDFPSMFARWRARELSALDTVAVAGDLLGRLKTSASAYGSSLILSSHSGSIVAYCGEKFIGAVSPMRLVADYRTSFDETSTAWDERLPRSTGFDLRTATGLHFIDPTDKPEPDEDDTDKDTDQ